MVKDANLGQKIDAAASKTTANPSVMSTADDMEMTTEQPMSRRAKKANERAALSKKNLPVTTLYVAGNTNTLSQVTGIIIGSPEFQRK